MKSYLLQQWHKLLLLLLAGAVLLAGAEAYSQQVRTAVDVAGTLEILIFERPDNEIVAVDYFLKTDSDLVYQLKFDADPPAGLTTGQWVNVEGYAEGSKLQVSNLAADPNPQMPTVGDRRAVVLMVNLQDARASDRYTLQQITDAMYTGARSVDKLYRAASLGQLGFVADSNNDGLPDVYGPFTINHYAAQGCNYYAWAEATEAAATAAGVNLSLYQHKVFVLPYYLDLQTCSWSGIANAGCGNSCRVWIAEGESPMIYAHELGHNLNMAHAGSDPENDGVINTYGDSSDPMGGSRAWHLFNAPHVDQMEWYSPYPGSIVTVTQNGTYDIHKLDAGPIELPVAVPRILKVLRPNGQGYYYLSYRKREGYDDSLSFLYTQGVNIHWQQPSDYPQTVFINALFNSAKFTDAGSGGIVEVEQVSYSPDYVTVNINRCISAPPLVTLLPSKRVVLPGGASSYVVGVINQDGPNCPATTFTLSYLGEPSATFTPHYLTLGGGASGSVTLTMNANPPGLASNAYSFEVRANDQDYIQPSHPMVVNNSATFIVDGLPPGAPANPQSTINNQGQVSLTWQASVDTLSGIQTYIVYRNGDEIGRTPGLSYVDNPPQGSNVYVVVAMDGAGNKSSSSTSMTINWAPRPTVTITAPADGATFTTDQAFTLTGTATNLFGSNLNATLSWTSSIDGAIGSGGSFTRTLSAGSHTLTAQATDNGVTGTATRTINVIRPSTLTFTSVGSEDGWVLESSETSNMGGSLKSNDTSSKGMLVGDSNKKQQYKSILSFDTAALPDNATITSATLRLQRGTLSGNNPFTYGPLRADIKTGAFSDNTALEMVDFQASATAVGVTSLTNPTFDGAWSEGVLNASGVTAVNKTGRTQFRLYFNLDDNNDGVADYPGYYAGEYGTMSYRPQLVVNYFANTAPVVTITTPTNETQVAPGTPITFSGTASDAEDGNLATRLVWTSSRDGVIGQSGSFTTSALSVGVHTITAKVTDGFGVQATASITLINSTNQRPTVTISAPINGARFIAGEGITFTGTANDAEDGNITPNLIWTSSINGNIGGGGSFSLSNLSVGTHTIQAQVTDSFGFTGKATPLTVTVANPTTVTFTSVGGEDGWVLESSETSNLGGSIKASDTSSKGLLLGDTRNNYQYQSILSFDTSSLPDNATIMSATLRLQRGTLSGTNPFTTHGALLADVVMGTFGSAALETADFQAPATVTGVVTLSNAASNGAWSEGAINVNGLAVLNKTGRTQFRLYFSLDDNNDKGDDYLGYYAGEYGTAASRPQLVVTYR